MRGYSLHDLYAKTLALLGLGMLAGTGALVDYWPSEGGALPVPMTPSVSLPAPAATLASAGVNVEPAAPAPQRRLPRTVVSPSPQLATALLTLPEAPPPLPPSGALGAQVPLPVFQVAAADTDDGPVISREPLAVAVAEPTAPAAPYARVEHPGAPVAGAIDESENGGLLTGAFRKTGNSLRKTGAKTGSSIVGAIRGFGGAFSGAVRRALPVI